MDFAPLFLDDKCEINFFIEIADFPDQGKILVW